MLPRPEYDRRAVSDQLDAFARLTAPDHRKTIGFVDGSEQLVVLTEGEVIHLGSGCQRYVVKVDHDLAARTCREMRGVAYDAVGDVEQRMSIGREPPALFEAKRW